MHRLFPHEPEINTASLFNWFAAMIQFPVMAAKGARLKPTGQIDPSDTNGIGQGRTGRNGIDKAPPRLTHMFVQHAGWRPEVAGRQALKAWPAKSRYSTILWANWNSERPDNPRPEAEQIQTLFCRRPVSSFYRPFLQRPATERWPRQRTIRWTL